MSENMRALKRLEDSCGVVMFGMALTHLMDIGVRHLTGLNLDEAAKQIKAESSSSDGYSIISPDFKIEIVRLAAELAKFEIWDIFYYIKYYFHIAERNEENV